MLACCFPIANIAAASRCPHSISRWVRSLTSVCVLCATIAGLPACLYHPTSWSIQVFRRRGSTATEFMRDRSHLAPCWLPNRDSARRRRSGPAGNRVAGQQLAGLGGDLLQRRVVTGLG